MEQDGAGNVTPEMLLVWIGHNDVDRLRSVLEQFNFLERSELTKRWLQTGNTLLCVAARRGRVPSINFLLDDCGADVDEFNQYGYSPLMCAAYWGNMGAVKTLVEHNAQINATSHTTAILQACSMQRIDIVHYLIENGADINIADKKDGATCLMHSVPTKQMCKLLIDSGAIVNAANYTEETAVHYAIEALCFESLETLLNHGGDVNICNSRGDDALKTAALTGSWMFVHYLISRFYFTPQRRADAYALLASSSVFVLSNFDTALSFWEKSFQIQREIPIAVSSIPIFGNAVEIRDINSLREIAHDASSMYTQALLVCMRILGDKHRDFFANIYQYAAYCSERGIYQLCIDLLKYLYSLNEDTRVVDRLCEVLWRIFTENIDAVRFLDVLHGLKMAVSSFSFMFIHRADFLLEQIHIACTVSTEADSVCLKQLLQSIIHKKQTREQTLLHLAVNEDSAVYDQLSSSVAVKIILESGADVNALDVDKNTPLHLAVFRDSTNSKVRNEVINLLIDFGAHVDIANAKREIVSYVIPNSLDHLTLKCFAARTIREHKIEYRGIVPQIVADFIDMH